MRAAEKFRLVLVTASSEEEAAEIAWTVVEERLAACVNIVPRIRSVYRWEGKVQDDSESLLFIKTDVSSLEALAARVAEVHSYSVPEVIALPLDSGRISYLDWLSESVRSQSGGGGA